MKPIRLIGFWMMVVGAWAQSAVLILYVRDQATRQSVPDAVIFIQGQSVGATDAQGYWSDTLAAGQYRVQVQHLNYEPTEYLIELQAGQVHRQDIWLRKRVFELPAVPVRVPRTTEPMERLPVQVLPQLPTPQASVEAALTLLPGVSSTNELSSQYSVRGGNFDDNLVFINGFEVYRPQLVRSAQYEGLSAMNPDLTQEIAFSSGAFSARYGGKMSSLLTVRYVVPDSSRTIVRASLLGASVARWWRSPNWRWRLVGGLRYQTYAYLLRTLSQKGTYRPHFGDAQLAGSYQLQERLFLDFLLYGAIARFRFIPREEVIRFGTVNQVLQFTAFMGGNEVNGYDLAMVGLRLRHDKRWAFQVQATRLLELQKHDVASAYWLGMVQSDPSKEDYGQVVYALGAGEYHQWRRNYLLANIYQMQGWKRWTRTEAGAGWRLWTLRDQLHEWERIDSAGYSLPRSDTGVLMWALVHSSDQQQWFAAWGYATRTWQWGDWQAEAGIRITVRPQVQEWLPAVRAAVARQVGAWHVRLATGVHYQLPFYREFVDAQGRHLWNQVRSQKSVHVVVSAQRPFYLWKKPFQYHTAVFGRYLWDLNPYDLQGVFIDYWAQNVARGYAVGWEQRVHGTLVPGTESWLALTLMQTREQIDGQWYPRPTDERFRVSMMILDRVPQVPNLRFTFLFHFASGLPFGPPSYLPTARAYRNAFRMPPYVRADIGLRLVLVDKTDPEGTRAIHNPAFRKFRRLWIDLQMFNMLNRLNVYSYYWIRDVAGLYYAVPRRLTGRLINVKIYLEW